MEISKTIEELLYYCHTHLYLDENDFDFYRNYLMHDLKIKKPYFGQIDKKQISNMEVVDHLFDQLVSYLINDLKYDMDDALHHAFELLGHLTPRPSEANKRFNELLKIDSKKATDYFYNLSVHSNYVQKTKIDKNIVIKSKIDNHELIVTINLSKPEKSNKDIVKMTQSKIKQESYPLCAICKENVGTYTEYKNSLRIINLALNNQHWFMQYSPYGYFDQHLIVVSDKHIPMSVEKNNLLAVAVCPGFLRQAQALAAPGGQRSRRSAPQRAALFLLLHLFALCGQWCSQNGRSVRVYGQPDAAEAISGRRLLKNKE